MSRVVSFINMKGGVGKTTSAVTLAEAASAEFGWKVLLVDLDAQASASYALCGDERYAEAIDAERTLAAFFDRVAEGKRPERFIDFVTPALIGEDSGPGVDVICSEPALRYSERALIERYYALRRKHIVTASAPEGQTRRIMREGLAKIADSYDLVVIDCPPGISIFAEAGVAASDLIVSPTIPDYLSTLGLKELNAKFINQLRRDGNMAGSTAILRTKVQASNAIHKRYLREIERLVSEGVIQSTIIGATISQSADIARAIDSDRQGDSFREKYKAVREDLLAYIEEIRELVDDAVTRRAAAKQTERESGARPNAA